MGRRRPRARGGHPARSQSLKMVPLSSPRTRGSSPPPPGTDRRPCVVPAHAGVIPAWCRGPAAARRRPRARGGHPGLRMLPTSPSSSSPRTRGSSLHRGGRGHPWAVVPAHAGVIRATTGVSSWPPTRRPRARGGHPRTIELRTGTLVSSPRTRGSSVPLPGAPFDGDVVPAHAGGHPPPARRSTPSTCRPRARGGHPGLLTCVSPLQGSSPRTRGSSDRRGSCAGEQRVVPAHTGVIPRRRSPDRRTGRRPRARGGHPDPTRRKGTCR